MSILWCGGEEIDFDMIGVSINTSTSYRRSDYSRCSFYVAVNGNTLSSKTFTASSSLWLSCQIIPFYWSSTNIRGIGFIKTGTNAYIGIGSGSADNKIAIFTYDGTTVVRLAEETGTSISSTVMCKIDIQIINYGPSGTVNVFLNGILVVTYTGNIAVLSQTTLDMIYFGPGDTSDMGFYVSEVIVADEDTRLMSLKTLAPDAAGDTNEWDGAYTAIDEVIKDDSDVIYTATADEDFQCNLTGMPSGDFICKGVKVAYRAADGIGGIGVKAGIKTNSTLDLSATQTLDGSWQTKEVLYQQNPITSNRFTPAEIEALQLAFQSATP